MENLSYDYSKFYEKLSLEEFRAISNKLSGYISVGYGYRKNEKYNDNQFGVTYIVAQLSNGKFYSRFDEGIGFDSIYRGQCEVDTWFDIEKIYSEQEFCVGIQSNGTVVTTLQEADRFFDYLKRQNGGTLNIKQILEMYDKNPTFLGLDTKGKVVIHQSSEVFHLRKNNQEESRYCEEIEHTIGTWPALKQLHKGANMLIGLTESGQVHCVMTKEYQDSTESMMLEKLSSLSDVENIVFIQKPSDYSDVPIVLTKNGRVYPIEGSENCFNYIDYSDVVQICAGSSKLLRLDRFGTLYDGVKKLDTDVVSIFPGGYVKADGTVYVREFKFKSAHSMIPDLKLFNDIFQIEEEWAETQKKIAVFKEYLADLELQLKTKEEKITQKNQEISTSQNKLATLGFFKFKEKKETKANIEQLNAERHILEQEKERVFAELRAISNTTPSWKRIDLNAKQAALMARVQQMRNEFVPKEKPKDVSVLKSAAVGAILAGPAGAVVGAVYAADKNSKNNTSQMNSSGKDKSVVGSAVVGGLVAGPAGAVVGAVYAADKNNKNKNKQ